MSNYNDNGQPQNYIFVVDDYSEPDHPTVMFTPVLYWKQEQSQSDWELNISIPWLSELMESTYEILWSVPGGPKTPQEAHDLLVAAGYVYSPAFAKAAGIYGNGSVVTKATKSKTAKFSTEFFKDYIVNVLAPDPKFGEIFNAYNGQPAETASLKRAKDWKRAFKKKAQVKAIAEDKNSIYGNVSFMLQEFYHEDHFFKRFDVEMWNHDGQVFDAAYLSTETNNVVVREFWWTGNEDRDTTISFITDESDTRMVAICYHID